MPQISRKEGLPIKTKLGYGAAEFSGTLTWTMISVLFLFFLTDVVGIEPAFAGMILMLGTLWDGVTDPAIGIISDRMKSRWGRRRPFILASAIPYGVITWLLFSDFGIEGWLSKVYFVLAIMAYYTVLTMLDVPYTSLAAEMTKDYDERTSLNAYRGVFSQIASIVAAALPWVLIASFTDLLGSKKMAWSMVAGIFGFCAVFPILTAWRATRGYEIHPEATSVSLQDILHGPLKNKTLLYTAAVYASGSVGLSVAGATMVYYMKYFMRFNETQESMAFLFLFACTIIWIPIINKISAKLGKRESFMIFMGAWAVIQGVFILFLEPSMTIIFYIMMVLASGGVMSISMTGWSLIPDAVEVDEFKTGQRREGLYVGVILVCRKFSVAFVLWMVGIALSWIGYVPNQVQSPDTLLGIKLLYSEGTAAFLLISVIMAYLLPMTRKRHEALKLAIQQKKEGKEWDDTLIRPIL